MASASAWLCAYLETLSDETRPRPAASHGWNAVAALAEAEGLAPALAFGLARGPDASVPVAVAARLAARLTQARARHVVMSRDMAALLRALASAGVPAIPLKGAYLAEVVYPCPALRPMSDIDVLVRLGDRLAVDEILHDLGYRRGTDAHSWAFDLAYDGATFYDGPGGARVDVHWRLLNDPRFGWNHAEADGVWDRALPVALAGEQALALAPEDLVLSLAAHLAIHHGLAGLVWYWDLSLVLDRRSATLDWDTLLARAEAWRVRRALSAALCRLADLFTVPGAARAATVRILPRGPRARAVRWLVAHRADRLSCFEHVIPLLLTDRVVDLVRGIGPVVWPSPAWVRARYGCQASVGRAYVVHAARLAAILGRTGQHLLGVRAGR